MGLVVDLRLGQGVCFYLYNFKTEEKTVCCKQSKGFDR